MAAVEALDLGPRPASPPFRPVAAEPAVSLKTWLAVIGANLGAFLAILNIQIVNAALADIQGAIGAGIDDGGWVSTSYLVTEIIVIPLSAWLTGVFSLRRYLLVNTALFLLFSAACASAQTLGQMIVLRAFQGFAGGVLIPLAFTVIITLLPRAKQPIGMALFAFSATFAPAIGPTIGGYLNENYGWQYIFYVNLLPGADHARHALVRPRPGADAARPPQGRRLARHPHHGGRTGRARDRAGGRQQGRLVRLPLHPPARRRRRGVVGTLPLDRVHQPRAAARICACCCGAISASAPSRISCWAPRSTARSSSCRSISRRCRATTAEQIGEVLAWVGLPQLVLIPFVPQLMRIVGPRVLVAAGLALFAVSNFMNIDLSSDVGGRSAVLAQHRARGGAGGGRWRPSPGSPRREWSARTPARPRRSST